MTVQRIFSVNANIQIDTVLTTLIDLKLEQYFNDLSKELTASPTTLCKEEDIA